MEFKHERDWLRAVEANASSRMTDAEYDAILQSIQLRRQLWEEGALNQFLNPIDHRRLIELADHCVRQLRGMKTGK